MANESSEIKSILDSVKKKCGINTEMTEFDPDLIDCINMALNTLTQVGVGPKEGFIIASNEETWEDFIGDDKRLNSVRTFVFLKSRIIFDPPSNSFTLTALQEQANEILWRMNIQVAP